MPDPEPITGDPAGMSLRDWALAFTQDRDEWVSGGASHVGQDHRAWVGVDANPGRYRYDHTASGVVVLTPLPAPPHPHRFVDGRQQGWWSTPVGITTSPHPDDEGGDGTRRWTYERITAERGPVRPVVPADTDAVEEICHHLALARTRAVTTLLAVLVHLRSTCWSNDGHDGRLTAGRPGSWESVFVRDLAWALDPISEDADLDLDAFTAVWDYLYSWVFDEDRYVEVAENVAWVTGRLVDGRGGWDQVSDPWVRHLDDDSGGRLRSYLTYTSRWHHIAPGEGAR